MAKRKTPNMREYQRLETGEGEIPRGSAEVYYTAQPMSVLHKAVFITSILFCFVVVASFLWLVPCDLASCPANKIKPLNTPWDRTLNGVELFGGVHVVGGQVLVVSIKGAMWGISEFVNGGGVVGLAAALGTVLWWVRLSATPTFLTCPPQEPPICFLLVPPSKFEALDPISGEILWGLTEKSWKQLDSPVLVPDSDKDGLMEVAVIVEYKTGMDVIVISGRTGKILERLPTPNTCDFIGNLTFDQSTAELFYSCRHPSGNTTMERLPLNGVFRGGSSSIRTIAERRTSFNEAHTVEYSNNGVCPDSCSVQIKVKDPAGKPLWTYEVKQAYIMRPLPLHFKPSLSGFLFKLWHWNYPSQENSDLRIESIKERIVLITFDNKPGGHLVNASQTEILRLCNTSLPIPNCQPSIHTDTAMIADVNGDGSQDLVSYYVTYKPVGEKKFSPSEISSWQLESRIRVIRLEAELPKLYEAVSSH